MLLLRAYTIGDNALSGRDQTPCRVLLSWSDLSEVTDGIDALRVTSVPIMFTSVAAEREVQLFKIKVYTIRSIADGRRRVGIVRVARGPWQSSLSL